MAITTLDQNTALVVVDLQRGILARPLAHPTEGVVTRTVALVEAFRAHDLPVVLVNVAGSPPGRTDTGSSSGRALPEGWTDLVPALGRQPGDIVVTKHARSAFAGTDLSAQLEDRRVTQVVVVGVATSSGVESTARDAHDLGFHVTLPVDAMTDSALDTHDHSLARVFPRIAETGTTQDVLDVLASRSA